MSQSSHTLRRPAGEAGSVIEESEPRRSASCFGASGMAGTALSPKALWLWLEYFWWNGEGIVYVLIVFEVGLEVVKLRRKLYDVNENVRVTAEYKSSS
jgi:hypothetical protein